MKYAETRCLVKRISSVLFVLFLCPPTLAQYEGKTLTVASYGGQVDESFKKATIGFEERFKVKIRWVPGTATENAAKVNATKASPEYDVVFLENLTHSLASSQGLLAPINTAIVKNYEDLVPKAKLASKDAVPIGAIFTGIFYNSNEFQKRGWAPPQSWNDLFRPEFCKHIGILHPNVSYTIHMLVMLGGGDVNKVGEGIDRLSKLKGCLSTLEPAASKLEEKIQLGEYLIGVHGTVRVLPLIKLNYPVKFIIPKEGTVLGLTTVSAVKNSQNVLLGQELVNWMISPAAQKVLVETGFWTPTNSKVTVPTELENMGLPPSKVVQSAFTPNESTIMANRRDWVRKVEREIAR